MGSLEAYQVTIMATTQFEMDLLKLSWISDVRSVGGVRQQLLAGRKR